MDDRASKAQVLVPRQTSLFLHRADQRVLYVPSCAVLCLVAQSRLPLCNPMDCPPGSSVCVEWAACSPPRALPNPGTEPRSASFQADPLPSEPSGKPRALPNLTQYVHVWPPCQTESALRLCSLSGYLNLLLLFSL